jgi:hypothetical protein
VAQSQGQILRFGAARATVYATARRVSGESAWPLYRITPDTRVEVLGELAAIGRSEFGLRPQRPLPAFMPAPRFSSGVFPDLPWFLDDQRPQGFLGRHFAHRVSPLLGVPQDLKLWTGDHVVTALVQQGHDQLGDLVLGERSLERALQAIDRPADVLDPDQRYDAYPQLARAALLGEPVGSSPGGEQQKFTATLRSGAGFESLIVKFSERGGNPVAERWASLLRCEALAAGVLNEHGVGAAGDRLFESSGQLFLESPRFDRTPTLGRRGMVSLAALDAATHGHGSVPWWRLAVELRRDGWIDAEDAETLQRLHWFGAMIGNSDMHLGNVSLELRDAKPLKLLPVYDMLPMLWRPSAQGSLPERTLSIPPPAPEQLAAWRWAAKAAGMFWAAVAETPGIDHALQRASGAAGSAIQHAIGRFG